MRRSRNVELLPMIAVLIGFMLPGGEARSAAAPVVNDGVVIVQVRSDFATKASADQLQDMTKLWRRFQAIGQRVTRFDVVQAGTNKVIYSYTPANGMRLAQ